MRRILPSSQRGSALVELAVVVTGLLGSLLLLTALLGKQIDAKHDYEQALRYAAWERTVWLTQRNSAVPNAPVKSNQEISNEVQARVFASRDVLLRSDQRAGTRQERLDLMMSLPTVARLDTRNDSAKPWVVDRANNDTRPAYASRTERNTSLNGVGAQPVNAMMSGLRALSSFDIRNDGLYQTQLEMDLGDTNHYKEFLTGVDNDGPSIDLRVDRQRNGSTRNLTLMADGWNAGGPQHEINRVSAMVATEFLDNAAIDTVMEVVGWFPMAREIGWLDFGHVNPEPVPAQRLGRY